MGEVEDLNSLLLRLAVEASHSVFLAESHESTLTYGQTYHLATTLLPTRLCLLCPQLISETSAQGNVVLISHNNALFPLMLWTCWHLSLDVTLLSINMDPLLWKGAINIVNPQLIIASRDAHVALVKQLGDDLPREQVVIIDDLIPPQYRAGISKERKSDYIPSLIGWLSEVPSSAGPPGMPPGPVSPDIPAVTLFTSSAIDVQSLKCVTYTHAMLVRSGERTIAMMGGSVYRDRPIRHLGWLPLSHCFEFCISLMGTVLRSAGTYIFFDSQVSSPNAHLSTPISALLLQAIQHHRPVHATCTVPAVIENMMKICTPQDLVNLCAMRSLGVGGAQTSETVFKWAIEHNIAYVDVSGATEAVGAICSKRSLDPNLRNVGLQMVPGMKGFLEKESPNDTHGELIIRATHLPINYRNTFSNSYSYDEATGVTTYRTGDIYEQKCIQQSLCYVKGEKIPRHPASGDQLSGLSYIGRIDDLVVLISGVKINALDLERSYDKHPDIEKTAVINDLDETAPILLVQPLHNNVGYLTYDQTSKITDYILRQNETLSYEKRIQTENIIFVESLPLTTKLTLNRKKIKKTWLESRGKWPGRLITRPEMTKSLHEDKTETRRRVKALLIDIFDISNESLLDDTMNFSSFAMTSSLAITTLAKALEDRFKVHVRAHQLYALQSIDDICKLVDAGNEEVPTEQVARSLSGKSEDSARTLITQSHQYSNNDLVISGLACCLPGGIRSPDAFWSALLSPDLYKARTSRLPPTQRWSSSTIDEKELPPVLWLEDDVLDNVETLADFFHLPPQEAASLSPNARLVMQLGYQALEDASIAPRSLAGKAWGVYTSVNDSGWRARRATECTQHELAEGFMGSADSAVGGRLSYFLDLVGPAVEIKTACSSSAVAIHHACMAIRNGDCEAAIVISATTHFSPSGLLFRAKAGITSMAGLCSPFTSDAEGFVPSEGATAIIIQKAADTFCEPYGVIRASRVMQDGRSHGFFAPNPSAQTRLLQETYKAVDCPINEVDFIECHGTGTRVGDAIEIQAINNFFKGRRNRPLLVGSVKAVFGHNEECAGMTGLIKILLCLRENAIPPQPKFRTLNPDIDFGSNKLVVPRRISALVGHHGPRRLGLSSFGISGTICHIILEDASNTTSLPCHPMSSPLIFVISANSLSDYKLLLKHYSEYILSLSALEVDIQSICRTTQQGRDHFAYRKAFAVKDHHTLSISLSRELADPDPTINPTNPRVGLWFSLPVSSAMSLTVDGVYHKASRFYGAKATWEKSFAFFESQLLIAYALRSLGCQVTAVGGEGMAELVAAVFAGILPYESVFNLVQQPTDSKSNQIFSAFIQRHLLEDILCQYTPSEVTLRGHHGGDLFTLQISSEEICSQLQRDFNLQLCRQTILEASPMKPFERQIKLPTGDPVHFISSYLGDTLDLPTLTSTTYWSGISTLFVDSQKGWDAMSRCCDFTIGIGSGNEFMSHLRDRCTSINDGEDFNRLICRLYENGCDLKWNLLGEGIRSHLPQYCWT